MFKRLLCTLVLMCPLSALFCNDITNEKVLDIFIKSYPDLSFTTGFDKSKNTAKVTVQMNDTLNNGHILSKDFYLAEGKLLSSDGLWDKENFWPMLYDYPKKLLDPADFTREQKERMKIIGSDESRKNSAGSPQFFFDFIYSAESEQVITKHIKSIYFFGKTTRVHERIVPALKRVDSKVQSLARTDKEVALFLQSLKSCDAFYWRRIRGTNRMSFHSYGIAIDLIPRSYGGKYVFWSWTKDQRPDDWMLVPLSRRWMPPQSVIDAFESEGFIWGGKWGVWDNMHFEYHPELLMFNGYR